MQDEALAIVQPIARLLQEIGTERRAPQEATFLHGVDGDWFNRLNQFAAVSLMRSKGRDLINGKEKPGGGWTRTTYLRIMRPPL